MYALQQAWHAEPTHNAVYMRTQQTQVTENRHQSFIKWHNSSQRTAVT
jgi:uncharacterized phage-associated protein